MDKYEVFKSVIFRTKSFKALIIFILIIACFVLQLSSNGVSETQLQKEPEFQAKSESLVKSESFQDVENYQLFDEEDKDIIQEEKSPNQDLIPELDKKLEPESKSDEVYENENSSGGDEYQEKKTDFASKKHSDAFEVQNMVNQGFKFMDNFVDSDSENYVAFKTMFSLWNPESSKWAVQASRKYKKALDMRPSKPKDWYPEPDKDRRIKRTVEVEQCGCQREILAHTMVDYEGGDHGNKSISTCSYHSFYRGAKQKIVSFSFYGNPNSTQGKERKYFQGIQLNLAEMPKIYDDWVLRVYYDLEPDHHLMKDMCEMACSNPNIDLCYVKELPGLGDISKVFAMNWRFMPMLDPQVSHMVSRDLDSLITQREKDAVEEWLDSDKAFHFMRDHPAHSIEVLGSGWGIRMSPLERTFIDSAFMRAVKDPIFWAPRDAYGPDQGFLKR